MNAQGKIAGRRKPDFSFQSETARLLWKQYTEVFKVSEISTPANDLKSDGSNL